MTNILQWNIRGLQANKEKLYMLLSHTHPSIVSLQEYVSYVMTPVSVTLSGHEGHIGCFQSNANTSVFSRQPEITGGL